MLEYRHQIQSYTCEIDALKGTVSRGQRGAKPASREGNAAPGCSGTSGLLPALRAAAGGAHSQNLGQQRLAWLCSGFWQSPGVCAHCRRCPSPGGSRQTGAGHGVSGCRVGITNKQGAAVPVWHGHGHRSRPGATRVAVPPPAAVLCSCTAPHPPRVALPGSWALLPPWSPVRGYFGTLGHAGWALTRPLPSLLRVITPHQLDPGSPLLGVPQKAPKIQCPEPWHPAQLLPQVPPSPPAAR